MNGWTRYNNSMPGFIADHNSVTRDGGGQIDWSHVPDSFKAGTKHIVKANGVAAQGATSVTVDALPVDLPVGVTLRFGTDEYATLTAPAVKGATSLAVAALVNAIEDNDEATYLVSESGQKVIPAGTIMAELSGGKMIPRSTVSGAETATCLLASNAVENGEHNAASGWGRILGGVIYENMLPDFGHANLATWKGELQAAGVGTGFAWKTLADTRAA